MSSTVAPAMPSADDSAQSATVSFARILVALDASDHADHALAESIRLAKSSQGVITGIHAYAAQLHDRRFRQMEGGLPERYLQEQEMNYQREVHDDLITRGLTIITDSYHDVAVKVCEEADLEYKRLSPEGKNYARLIEAAKSGDFDVLALGSVGLGQVAGSVIGTVCERVVRRSPIDTLVIKDCTRAIGDGPIVVGIDGSGKSYGALIAALEIAKRTDAKVLAVAAYDPYYHYVAFNKIAGVLSEEAGKVFRFQEQEQLHEELIDDGIARIYESHLDIAQRVASDLGAEISCELLEGKPWKAVNAYVKKVNASLLMVGKTGIHVDAGLDIGGNSENLLRMVNCHIWLGQSEFTPPLDQVAEETISWSAEAEAYLGRAPGFVQGMARKAVMRKALETGHTYITSDLVQEVAEAMMPSGCPAAKAKPGEAAPLAWSDQALALLAKCEPSQHAAVNLRAEKHAKREGAARVEVEHVRPFVEIEDEKEEGGDSTGELIWNATALARLVHVPETMREATKERIEQAARDAGVDKVDMNIVERGLEKARAAMNQAMHDSKENESANVKKCPVKHDR